MIPVIFSNQSFTLSETERRFFRESNPLGFILFKRNIDTPAQLKRLTSELRESVGRDCPILIDQEGGRVQRMATPHWALCPSAQACATVDDVRAAAERIATDLVSVGIDVNCAPVLDVLNPVTHQAIGDRAFSDDPTEVYEKGRLTCDVFLSHGVTPVIKHMPGQGRADVDSHHDLPVVRAEMAELDAVDFHPFRRIAMDDLPVWGMMAHVIYTAIDPNRPATLSPDVVRVIRRVIGFDGLLVSDDVSMGALKSFGNIAENCKSMLESGLDIALYCWAHQHEMEAIAAAVPAMSRATLERYDRSRLRRRPAAPF